ncbi:MAG: F420-dependent oxidoreductase [uncultured Acidimicrobiales bacterium]|uniref:F420-dependent oxidoreductase n=1 Tax=uncultured Acidimicrobiales bacterium TaxID=310071 RepID=A0A6J4HE87_9ACTN|nr:MAG: F420-dependent oxidoreductase [uncultured Acidimicrobiales bacterium]
MEHEEAMPTDRPQYAVRYVDLSHEGGMKASADVATVAEDMACGALWTAEVRSDAFLQAVPALAATTTLRVATGIVIGFARSPMTIAQEATDLQDFSDGRFILGLGSQIRTHVTKRFSMPWGKPVEQMAELLASIRAIWSHWYDGDVLDFRGQYYRITFNSDVVRVRPTCPTRPPIHIAAVGPRMTSLAGEAADGFIGHSFVTERYMRDVVLPRLTAGARAKEPDYDVVVLANAVVPTRHESVEQGLERVRAQVAMYGSTPAYRGVLDIHGLGDLHEELHRLSKLGRWDDMARLVDDETLGLFTVWGEPAEVARELYRRYGNVATRLRVPFAAATAAAELVDLVREGAKVGTSHG